MNQSYNRVVVTGMGAITPVGNSVQETWNNLISGKNGIGPITQFDTENYKAKLGAEVKDFNPLDYMEKVEMLRSDRYTHLAVAAAAQAVEDSGIDGKVIPERFAVYFGAGIGGIKTFETEYAKLADKGPRRVSPFFIPMFIPNMAAGTIAIRYNCRGSVMPAVTACASGSNAIGEALRVIRICRRRHRRRNRGFHLSHGHCRLCQHAGTLHRHRSRCRIASLRRPPRRFCHR